MGEVFLAEHMLLRRPCAVKLIRPDQADDPKMLKRFECEVRATARLTHWNTVEIYDFGNAADGTFYYVMEYLPGLSLQDLVERHGPLDPARVVHLLLQVCAGLREAHQMGLIHRDIKPSNLLVCERGGVQDVIKVVDFGLVKRVGLTTTNGDHKLTQEGTLAGSPMYMSPEQANGKDHLDVRSDIYNVGAVAYFMLTGQPPFVRESTLEMLFAHLREPVRPIRELRPEVPDDLQAILLRCLAKSPEQRYQDVNSLRKALGQCSVAGKWTEEHAAEWWRSGRATTPESVRNSRDALAKTTSLASVMAS
jgi:serine/threonine-protein kinase